MIAGIEILACNDNSHLVHPLLLISVNGILNYSIPQNLFHSFFIIWFIELYPQNIYSKAIHQQVLCFFDNIGRNLLNSFFYTDYKSLLIMWISLCIIENQSFNRWILFYNMYIQFIYTFFVFIKVQSSVLNLVALNIYFFDSCFFLHTLSVTLIKAPFALCG